jgi:hypothetical protein
MRIRLSSRMILLLVALSTIALGVMDVSARQQRRRKRPSRRVTSPVVTQPATATTATTAQPAPSSPTTDPTILSTASDADTTASTTPATTRRSRSRAGAGGVTPESEQDTLRRTVDKLSTQVTQLTDKIGKMEEQQRTLVDMERLSRAETRAENFRTQLRDVQAKEAELQARAEQIEYDLRPENIERSTQSYGSTRPEEVRDARRRQLENERTRVQSQLQLMAQSRARLETAIASADAEADTLRRRMEEAGTAPKTDTGDTTTTEGTTTTTTTPPPDQP